MKLARAVGIAVLSLYGAISSQSVVPQSLAGVEASSSTRIPFGLSSPVRMQSIYERDTLPFSAVQSIHGIRLRVDGDNGAMNAKQFVTVDIWMSTSYVTAPGTSEFFAQNHGNDLMKVLSFERFALPALVDLDPTLLPRGFDIEFDFDQSNGHPGFYGLTPLREGREVPSSLVVEIRVLEQPAGIYWMDTPFACSSPSQTFRDPADACFTGAGPLLSITSSDDIRAGGRVTYTVTDMPPDVAFTVMVSPTDVGLVAGLPLPVHLGGVDPLLGLPADGCFVYVNPLISKTGVSADSGVGSVSFSVPTDLGLVGIELYAQAVAVDISANLLGLVTSNRVSAPICGPLPVARVVATGDPGAASGTATLGAAMVMEIY